MRRKDEVRLYFGTSAIQPLWGQNGAVRMNQEESIMSDVSECMLDDGGETSSESECLSGKSGKSKRVLQPQVRNAKGHCVPRSLMLNKVFVLE